MLLYTLAFHLLWRDKKSAMRKVSNIRKRRGCVQTVTGPEVAIAYIKWREFHPLAMKTGVEFIIDCLKGVYFGLWQHWCVSLLITSFLFEIRCGPVRVLHLWCDGWRTGLILQLLSIGNDQSELILFREHDETLHKYTSIHIITMLSIVNVVKKIVRCLICSKFCFEGFFTQNNALRGMKLFEIIRKINNYNKLSEKKQKQ